MARHEDISTDIPSELQDLASQIRAMPGDAPEGLEARVFDSSVRALREGCAQPASVAGKIGPLRWIAPVAAAAAVGLLAWAGAAWLVPSNSAQPDPGRVSTVALDDHVSDVLAYADLFTDSSWGTTLAEDAQELDEGWEPTVEAWSLDSETGAS
ncbi:MAG: hypothetical protein ACIAQU_04675 [Phycisphaerales bacterium JB064]